MSDTLVDGFGLKLYEVVKWDSVGVHDDDGCSSSRSGVVAG